MERYKDMIDWEFQTCEKCQYAISGRCRRFPPSSLDGNYPAITRLVWITADIGMEDKFIPACAEFRKND